MEYGEISGRILVAIVVITVAVTNALGQGTDYGDADASRGYPVDVFWDGARHLIVPGWQLGERIDGDPNGQSSFDAQDDDRDGIDDEDGVYVWQGGYYEDLQGAYFQANVSYTLGVVASTTGYLNAWMDFNDDGDWADTGEHIYTDTVLSPGTNALVLHIPVTASNSLPHARFRFGSQMGLSDTGWAEDGEVEDYEVELNEGIRIKSISVQNSGIVTIEWNDTGLHYTVEVTTNLLSPSWSPAVGTWPMQHNMWSGSASTNNCATFYRVLRGE